MSFLLDTNVLSEPAKRAPDANVVAWLEAQSPLDMSISVLTIGELTKGAELLAEGQRRAELLTWIRTDLPRQFVGRIQPVDADVASEWGRLSAEGRARGRELPVIDGLLLATASVHGLTFVTRNAADCVDRGVAVLNPWKS